MTIVWLELGSKPVGESNLPSTVNEKTKACWDNRSDFTSGAGNFDSTA